MFSTDVCGGHAVNFSIDKTRADGASYIYNNKPEERAARMVLTIDIGNTNIVLGGYENGALGFCTRISTDKSLEADQYALELSGILNLYKVAGENIEGAIISSVVPQITDTVARALRMFSGVEPLKLTQELPTGVGVNIDTPSELGADLLAGAIAAKALYPLPAIVIDMGTATKITAVDEQGTVQGVSIMPGVFISLDALVNGTSLLKGIATNAPVRAIGKNTVESMQSGVVFGAASMLDGMVERFEAELGPAKTLVATGGAAGIVVPHCRHSVQYVPTLILDGLYAVYCRTHAAL